MGKDRNSHDHNLLFTTNSTDDWSKKLRAAQLSALTTIEIEYKGKKVPRTNSLFESNDWLEYSDEERWEGSHNIYWKNYHSLQPYARKLICKHMLYQELATQRLALSTTQGKMKRLNRFFKYFDKKEILLETTNAPLIGLNSITREEIEEYIDYYLETGIGIKSAAAEASVLSDLKNSLSAFNGKHSFIQMGSLPWELDEKTPWEWVKQRMSNLRIIIRDPVPFQSFGPDTTVPLVERSMDILDHYADKAVKLIQDGSLFGHVKKDAPAHRFSLAQRRIHAKKYGSFFDPIVQMEIYPNGSVKEGFYGSLFDIVQGAMLNIIFFTSGLRNIDIRNLKIGCCVPSEVENHLFYIITRLQKTSNEIHIPVPEQTYRAIKILEKMRFGECDFLVAKYKIQFPSTMKTRLGISGNPTKEDYINYYKTNVSGETINNKLRKFAAYFDIPFVDNTGAEDGEGMAHRYRATTASWIASASNLSVLLVRRLFGHTNNLMPLAYLHHNPHFVQALEDIAEVTHNQVAENLTSAAADKRIGGVKGKQLQSGFEYQRGKSQSLSDAQLRISFKDQLKERITSGQLCGFMTPLSVICGRNPNDTSQTPCSKKAYKNKIAEKEINQELLEYMSLIRPDHCIGNMCKEAIIGEWSTALRDSFIWYTKLLEGVYGDQFTAEHYRQEAKSFIKQYATDMMDVFGLETRNE